MSNIFLRLFPARAKNNLFFRGLTNKTNGGMFFELFPKPLNLPDTGHSKEIYETLFRLVFQRFFNLSF